MLLDRGPVPGENEVQAGCKLMDGFAIFIQLCLAAAAFSTLILKRQRETPQRPVRIWAFDVSKQLVGGIVIHSLNVIAAYLFGTSLEGDTSNPCVWYFLNILVDTTLGVVILWFLFLGFDSLTVYFKLSGFRSGVYGSPPLQQQMKRWGKQLGLYIASLVIMKAVVVILFRICPWIEDFGRWVLRWTLGNYKLQVVFVMLIFPLVMNIIQFWIVDTIVKHKSEKKAISLSRDEDEEESSPFTVHMEEEEEDGENERHPGSSFGLLQMNEAGSQEALLSTQHLTENKNPHLRNEGSLVVADPHNPTALDISTHPAQTQTQT